VLPVGPSPLQDLVADGDASHAPPHTGNVEDTTPLAADDGLYLCCARTVLAHMYSSNRERLLEITARGITLQRVLDASYLSAAKDHDIHLN
jgi:hypothetical protein